MDFSDVVDPHVVAGLLKMYIREYPEPLLTFELVSIPILFHFLISLADCFINSMIVSLLQWVINFFNFLRFYLFPSY